jgi:hypothetical protein|eukprot:COSAG03_NODE_264_length_9700_cov_10.107176_5_plen_239_part_00
MAAADGVAVQKPVLALDIDEVCAQFVPGLIRYHNEKYGTGLKTETFHSYTFADVWGGTDEESVAKVFDFFTTEHFLNLEPVQGSVEAVASLVDAGFDVVGVTSRQLVIEDPTRAWLDRHFPGLFRDVLFGNHWVPEAASPDLEAEGVVKKTKREMVEAIGAVALVDDSCKYVRELAGSAGGPNYRKSILFGEYAWNQAAADELPANCVRVADWKEALEQLLPLLGSERSSSTAAAARA